MKTKSFTFIVTEDSAGQRLDKALATHPEIDSRSQAADLIDRGLVTCAGRTLKNSYKVKNGEAFVVEVLLAESASLEPFDFALDIVFEDDFVIVVNKPSGLVVHPSAGHQQDTLVNALLHHSPKLAQTGVASRPGIVHRIDKDTSGLLVIAKTDTALRLLAQQFKKKTAHRIYQAVTFGLFTKNRGTITSHLRRHPTQRKKFASSQKISGTPVGKLAITHYEVDKIHPSGLSLVKCKLETGRTHQIRVHLSEAGHPIVADPLYTTSHRVKSVKSLALRESLAAAPHLMLHAAELGFEHPKNGKTLLFKVDWPEELHDLLASLGFR